MKKKEYTLHTECRWMYKKDSACKIAQTKVSSCPLLHRHASVPQEEETDTRYVPNCVNTFYCLVSEKKRQCLCDVKCKVLMKYLLQAFCYDVWNNVTAPLRDVTLSNASFLVGFSRICRRDAFLTLKDHIKKITKVSLDKMSENYIKI